MKLAHLKKIRVVVSMVVLVYASILFVDWGNSVPGWMRTSLVSLQLGPALTRLVVGIELWSICILIVLLVTLLFGRVYCSSLCPLGTIQDLAIRWSRRGRRRRFRYHQPATTLQYAILMLTLVLALAGSMVLVNLLEPFSLSGRILGGLARPLLMTLNNLAASILSSVDVYFLSAIPSPPADLALFGIPVAFLAAIVMLSIFRGRWFCNSLCPVGALLGLVSRGALFRIVIDESTCKDCGLCEKVCKAECIDSKAKKIDFHACVSCFNCLDVCPTVGLKYAGRQINRRARTQRVSNVGRRKFLRNAPVPLVAVLSGSRLLDQPDTLQQGADRAPITNPVTPPGSVGTTHFSSLCTACHLCVSVCPTQVLQPSFLEYGWEGLFQPRMDYEVSYCNYECVLCSEVCPTGAILKQGPEEKKLTQIGKARFIKEDCIVITKKKDCAACAEHCPTKAVRMVPYEGLRLPEVNNDICVGCGACEHACPVDPRRAIIVEANFVHLTAQKPPSQKLELEPTDEAFPF